VTYNSFNMALRISAKRVAATLKASNVTSPSNGILKRNGSKAATAASSLPEEIRSAIHACPPAPRLNIN
jgi:acetylornithine aminotransferase